MQWGLVLLQLFLDGRDHSRVGRFGLGRKHRRQEAVWMCGAGDLGACDAMNAYEAAPPGVKRGPVSTQDFIR